MSDLTAQSLTVADYYKNLYTIHGAVLDEDSYNRHLAAESVPQKPTDTPATSVDPFDAPQDFRQMAAQAFDSDRQEEYRPECASFAVPVSDDVNCMEYVETSETYCPETMRIVIGGTQIVRNGSGSFRTSGSYQLSSGSYRVTSGSFHMGSGSFHMGSGSFRMGSGSFRMGSGSFHMGSGSFHMGSGSFRMGSGSFRMGSGSFRMGSGSFRMGSGSFRLSSGSYRIIGSFKSSGRYVARTSANPPMPLCDPTLLNQDAPYLGSLPWGMDVGGYGLNLI